MTTPLRLASSKDRTGSCMAQQEAVVTPGMEPCSRSARAERITLSCARSMGGGHGGFIPTDWFTETIICSFTEVIMCCTVRRVTAAQTLWERYTGSIPTGPASALSTASQEAQQMVPSRG